jgi:imidazolonepropionase-like amidohydrolase
LAGDTQAQAVVEPVVAMRADLVATSRAGSLETIRELLDDVRDFDANRSSYDRGARRDYVASRRDLDALVPVVRGNLPLVLAADRGSDIEALLRFAREERVKLVIDGGAEAHLFAAELAAAAIPVIVRPLAYGAGRFGQIRARRDGTKILAEAGVAILFSTRSAHSLRKLRQLAGNAVREGLTHAAAMKSTTAAVAAVFGMANRADLSVGAVADLVVWSGDPLELGSRVDHMLIHGKAVSLKGRQEALMERYRTLPGSPVPALELP